MPIKCTILFNKSISGLFLNLISGFLSLVRVYMTGCTCSETRSHITACSACLAYFVTSPQAACSGVFSLHLCQLTYATGE